MMKRVFTIAVCFVLVLTACGERGSSSDSNQGLVLATAPAEYADMTNPLGEDAASEGGTVFQSMCSSCHGETGKGDGYAGQSLEPKPKDLTQVNVAASDGFLFWRISKGSPGTAMIGWSGILDDEQIWQVVSFIRTLK
jgi:mono/diheme cytochrome c family protein